MKRLTVAFALLLAAIVGYFIFAYLPGRTTRQAVQVLSYSTFVNSWGPGPEIVKQFKQQTGIDVVLLDAGDAGLILKKLELSEADAVIGLDQLLLDEARKEFHWKNLNYHEVKWAEPDFMPFDWGPLAFVYRQGEIAPPKSLDDLLDARFKKQITLQDPRTSTTGLQFLYWVLAEKGEEAGFAYLAKLKDSIHTVASSWSSAYGIFQKKQASLALSYLTSPVYHWTVDKDESYQAAAFENGNPVQVEYAGVPEKCQRCIDAEKFLAFLRTPDIQKQIMMKNIMFSVLPEVIEGTPFARLPKVKELELHEALKLNSRRQELLDRWVKLAL